MRATNTTSSRIHSQMSACQSFSTKNWQWENIWNSPLSNDKKKRNQSLHLVLDPKVIYRLKVRLFWICWSNNSDMSSLDSDPTESNRTNIRIRWTQSCAQTTTRSREWGSKSNLVCLFCRFAIGEFLFSLSVSYIWHQIWNLRTI